MLALRQDSSAIIDHSFFDIGQNFSSTETPQVKKVSDRGEFSDIFALSFSQNEDHPKAFFSLLVYKTLKDLVDRKNRTSNIYREWTINDIDLIDKIIRNFTATTIRNRDIIESQESVKDCSEKETYTIYYSELLCKAKQYEKALDTTYDCIDDLLISGEYNKVDKILQNVDPNQINSRLIVAILSLTKLCKSSFKNRKSFLLKAKSAMKSRDEYNKKFFQSVD